MLAAFPYECSCGRRFVVGFDDDGGDSVDPAGWGWIRTLRRVASSLGLDMIDANDLPRFTCPSCGRVHARSAVRAERVLTTGESAAVTD